MVNVRNVMVFFGAVIFGFGLAWGGMTKPEVILSFLTLQDFGLLVLMGSAVFVSSLGFFISRRFLHKPLFGEKFDFKASLFDRRIIVGAVIFGVGWGISGICPGSAFASLGTGNYPIMAGVIGMFIGALIQGKYFR